MGETVAFAGILHRDQVGALMGEALTAADESENDGSLWWRYTGSDIELGSGLPLAVDVRHHRMMLHCGAVLLNLRILLRGLGVQPSVRILPDARHPDLIATIRLENPRAVADYDRTLVAAVLSRAVSLMARQSREPGAAGGPAAFPGALISPLRRAAKTEQAWLALQPMAAVAAASPDGAGTIGEGGTALIVGTVLDGPAAQLHAGQAMQRVMLTATALGAQTAPLRELLYAAEDRRRIRGLLGGALWPQAVLVLDSDLNAPVRGWGDAAGPVVP